jgi:hypothetical protein
MKNGQIVIKRPVKSLLPKRPQVTGRLSNLSNNQTISQPRYIRYTTTDTYTYITTRQLTTSRTLQISQISPSQRAQQRAQRRIAAMEEMIAKGGAVAAAAPTQRNNILYFFSALTTSMFVWGCVDAESPPMKAAEFLGIKSLYDRLAETFNKPHVDNLLPDWPMPNVPANIPCPHTLVLDLEETLVNASWDKRYGWRYAKVRTGVNRRSAAISYGVSGGGSRGCPILKVLLTYYSTVPPSNTH